MLKPYVEAVRRSAVDFNAKGVARCMVFSSGPAPSDRISIARWRPSTLPATC